MGSRLSRQNSLDNENFSKKRRKLLRGAGEGDRGSRGGGDFLFALMLKSDKLPGMLRRTNHSPYMRRVAWIKEIQKLLRERRMEQATDVLRLLRKVRSAARMNVHFRKCRFAGGGHESRRFICLLQTCHPLAFDLVGPWTHQVTPKV